MNIHPIVKFAVVAAIGAGILVLTKEMANAAVFIASVALMLSLWGRKE